MQGPDDNQMQPYQKLEQIKQSWKEDINLYETSSRTRGVDPKMQCNVLSTLQCNAMDEVVELVSQASELYKKGEESRTRYAIKTPWLENTNLINWSVGGPFVSTPHFREVLEKMIFMDASWRKIRWSCGQSKNLWRYFFVKEISHQQVHFIYLFDRYFVVSLFVWNMLCVQVTNARRLHFWNFKRTLETTNNSFKKTN